jgi:hypothetical protein
MLFENNYAALPDLDSDEERVCALVDGQRSVQDIVDASLLGSFIACKTLVQLLERGALRLSSKRAESKSGNRNLLVRTGIVLVSGCWLAALAAWILFPPASFLESTFPVVRLLSGEKSQLQQAFVRDEADRLERALEIYRLITGEYPQALSGIAGKGILSQQELASMERHAIVYRKTGGSYEIAIGP